MFQKYDLLVIYSETDGISFDIHPPVKSRPVFEILRAPDSSACLDS